MQNEELRTQLHNQTALIQLLVGRFGGADDAASILPDTTSLPCNTVDELQDLNERMSDRLVRTSVVSIFTLLDFSSHVTNHVHIWIVS